ncbi:ANTAR domain-containing protein [Streptomyces sp. RY43-2]|uniref:ANTAR domain-containing protein n=1 Tax=Streptomyces macrolidinus TaxID=2952607 RepID=A0ABT0ZB87_9ACTN|nr:ANTAR domain-containing protein [Streptomyces macrolidinus]MCN9241039.1 ANTAR domain-containing protein [Streptomyces macrolidinus]
MESHGAGDRTSVLVAGELDIGTEQTLRDALHDALRVSASGVDLDLAGVDFCDCSGLNALLFVRRRALRDAKTLALTKTGPAVGRLLSLTGTRSLFDLTGGVGDSTPTRPVGGHHGLPRIPPAPSQPPGPDGTRADEPDRDLRIELVQLRRAMQTRPVIDLARGVLMASFALSAQEAWGVLVTVSQKTNTKLHRVAQELVDAVAGEAPAGPVRQELAAAVSGLRETDPASWTGVAGRLTAPV